ncbi:MAG: S9 family peptidase, partial [Gemmatimonadetes bacterium]|nr:S9 family peptidase [Gemmatimonadota bacterium]
MHRRHSLLALSLMFVSGAGAVGSSDLAAQTGPQGTLQLETYLDWEWVSEPRLSPDGRQILYTRSYVDQMRDRRASAVWIMNADGTRNRFLVDGSSPRWSPDGTRIAYMDDGDPSGTQIFVRWMDDEGATTQISRTERAASDLQWSPDGRWLAFTMSVEDEPEWRVRLPSRPEGARWTEDPKVVDRLSYRRDRQGFIDDGYSHVFVIPAEGGTPRQLTDGEWNHRSPRWTADGRSIVFSSLRVEEADHEWRESEIYAVDVAGGAIRQLTSRRGPDNSPTPSPDGRLIAYTGYDWTDDTYITSKIYVMNADGSQPRMISGDFDRDPGDLMWAPDNSGLYFNVSHDGASNLHFVSVRGGVEPVTRGNHMVDVGSIANGVAAATITTFNDPEDIYTFPLRQPDRVTRLTEVNADVLAGVRLGEVEEIQYRSVDDFEIEGWIVKPPDFDPSRKYPLMLSIHGGPHGMYNVGFNFGWQEHAANGYVVLYTNPRGSSGYGSAFGNSIKNAYPGK